jgi:hypothetical protein
MLCVETEASREHGACRYSVVCYTYAFMQVLDEWIYADACF